MADIDKKYNIVSDEEVHSEMKKREAFPRIDASDKDARAAVLAAVEGHPLNTFKRENDALVRIIDNLRFLRTEGMDVSEALNGLQELSVHYAKKGDLLYPLLKVKYGVCGPADVMWTADDEIRDELSALVNDDDRDESWYARLDAALYRAENMIAIEQNVLFPICAVCFNWDEWKGIYRDSKDYSVCFGEEDKPWTEGEGAERQSETRGYEGEIVMPGGHVSLSQLTALLNVIPMEITFIDEDNINRFFNEGPKVFKRPVMALDREVFSCHPPKLEPMVRGIIDDLRSGGKDSVPMWMEKGGKTLLVTYYAVRDKEGKYLGTVELAQDMEFAKAHFLNS